MYYTKNRIHLNIDIIDKFIIDNRMKLSDFCSNCGISRMTFNNMIKNGHITSRGTLYKLAYYMNVKASSLIKN